MYLPEELWAYIQTYLSLKDFCWPNKVRPHLRRKTRFIARCQQAGPLHKIFINVYRYCIVEGCTASRGAFRDFIVSPYCVQHACEWSCPRIIYFRAPMVWVQAAWPWVGIIPLVLYSNEFIHHLNLTKSHYKKNTSPKIFTHIRQPFGLISLLPAQTNLIDTKQQCFL